MHGKDGVQLHGPKRILVTGGAGFLGSALCMSLVDDEGNHVICLDNFHTGSRSNIVDLLERPNFDLITHDITDPISIEVDEIFNFACPASPIHYQHDPVQTVKTNVQGAINVLDLAKNCHARIFQASTSEIYGDPKKHPQTEEYWGNVNPIGIRSCYDEGKRCAETLFFDFFRQYAVDIRIGRFFNTYGPRMHPQDGRVVSNFINQALRGEPITIYGDGNQTRSFCYVDDLINGVRLLMDHDGHTGPVNLGNPHEFTIRELAELVIDITNSKSVLMYLPALADDPRQRKPDISLAKVLLKWEPKVPLRAGLLRTVEYFEKLVSDGRARGRLQPVLSSRR